jgi:DNA-binding LacI/PurR family transcriptional regulator
VTKAPKLTKLDVTVASTKGKLTLLDVAAAVGVSRTTVSNAFNRPEQLSKELREAIFTKARELGYLGPDPAARALRLSSLHEVAVVFPQNLSYALTDPLSINFLQGVAKEMDARQLSLQLIPNLGRSDQFEVALQTTANALIFLGGIATEIPLEIRSMHKPLVLVDAFSRGTVSVNIQDRDGAVMAMNHVLKHHPDEIIVLGFPVLSKERFKILNEIAPPHSASITGERMAGYVYAAREAGFPLNNIHWLEIDELAPESVGEQIERIHDKLAIGRRIGIVAMSDRIALSTRSIVSTWTNVKVVSVVGFDDIPAAAAAGLTTIRQDASLKGELAVQALLDGVIPYPLPVSLVIRET